jgi:hypothetical protein
MHSVQEIDVAQTRKQKSDFDGTQDTQDLQTSKDTQEIQRNPAYPQRDAAGCLVRENRGDVSAWFKNFVNRPFGEFIVELEDSLKPQKETPNECSKAIGTN